QPEPWFRKWPLKWEITTLHVDRAAFDQKLFEKAQSLGTTFRWDRVTSVDTEGERVVSCQTAAGRRLRAAWFLDNSGHARLFGRAFGIRKVEYGRPKVCLWTYFDCPI